MRESSGGTVGGQASRPVKHLAPFSLAAHKTGIMLAPMQRRVWVLVAAAVALVGCGGEKFTVATDQGVTDQLDSGTPGGGVNTSCNQRSQCELVAVECCGSCTVPGQPSQLPLDQVIAVNQNAVGAYRQSVCDSNDTRRCLDCPDTVEVQGYQADCDNNGQCVIAESPQFASP